MLRTDQTIKLKEGRTLGYAEFGDPAGTPVFFFHGSPGSRLEGLPLDVPSQTAGIRLICPDRPGMGLSDPQPGRTLLDWPGDVAQLATALHIDRFAVLGIAGGSPYALACAARLSDRLTAVGIVSGFSPRHRREVRRAMKPGQRRLFAAATWTPWLVWHVMSRRREEIQSDAAALVTRMVTGQPKADRIVLEQPGMQEMLPLDLAETFRQESDGPAGELILLARDWGFACNDIQASVQIWHGRRDVITPPAMATELAMFLPHTLTRWFPEEGHFLLYGHAGKILAQLTS